VTAPFLPANDAETLYRGDTRTWTDVLEENTGTDAAPIWTPLDVTGWIFLSQIRADTESTTVMATVAVAITDAAAGTITRTLSATEAAKLVPGKVYFDLQATHPDGSVRTYLAGKWTVKGDVSRA
jgi:hypothetical protein